MSKPKVENGKIDILSVSELSKQELKHWIDARLHGLDSEVPGDFRQGEPPYYLITLIYPDLDRNSRDYIHSIVYEFLLDMSRNRESSWQEDAAHALLLLAQNLEDRTFIPPILEMAEGGRFFKEGLEISSDDLHRRLLQSLVALEWRGSIAFWCEQVGRAPERYAGVTFAGLAQIALKHAVDLLLHLPLDNPDVRAQIRVALRGLLPARDHSEIAESLMAVRPSMSDPDWNLVLSFLPEIHKLIDDNPSRDLESVKEVLRDIGGMTDFSPKTLSHSGETHS